MKEVREKLPSGRQHEDGPVARIGKSFLEDDMMMCEKNEDTGTGRAEYVLLDESRGKG